MLELYKSIHHLNPKCISCLFEVKPTNYSLKNPVKLVQPMKRISTYGLRSVSYTCAKLWNDLSPLLSNDVEIEDFKSLMTILMQIILIPPLPMYNSLHVIYECSLNIINFISLVLKILIVYNDPRTVYICTLMSCNSLLANVVCFTCTTLNKVYLILYYFNNSRIYRYHVTD